MSITIQSVCWFHKAEQFCNTISLCSAAVVPCLFSSHSVNFCCSLPLDCVYRNKMKKKNKNRCPHTCQSLLEAFCMRALERGFALNSIYIYMFIFSLYHLFSYEFSNSLKLINCSFNLLISSENRQKLSFSWI